MYKKEILTYVRARALVESEALAHFTLKALKFNRGEEGVGRRANEEKWAPQVQRVTLATLDLRA